MRRPKLLVIGPLPPPPGGGETVTQVLLDSALANRYDLRHFDTTRRQGKEHMGRFTVSNAWRGLRHVALLARTLREFRPDIVHVPLASPRAAIVRDRLFTTLIRRSGAALILHSHAGRLEERYAASGPRWRAFVRGLLAQGDALVCLTPRWQSFFDALDLGVPTTIIRNPLEPELLAAIDRTPARSADGTERLLYVGAICEPKGVLELLDALEVLTAERPGLRARLVGGKQFAGDFERIQARHAALSHRDRVELTGPLYGEALAREYRSADLLVLPSHYEAMPMVLIEAMAAELPVVATGVGGIPDVVEEGVGGLLVRPGGAEELAQALRRLLDDRPLRERMAATNRETARRLHSADTFVDACDALYVEVLARRQAAQ